MNSYLIPEWPAPKNVKAYSSIRYADGYSSAPFDNFNLGDHVGDSITHVTANRNKLKTDLNLKTDPKWLQQVHGNTIIDTANWQANTSADGSFSKLPNEVCVVMTADCLPILLCNQSGTQVMALHGGWRSLAANIIPQGITLFDCPVSEILVWLGPAIGPTAFEVGEEVREKFLALAPKLSHAFLPSRTGHWMMNIYAIATYQLTQLGVTQIFGGGHCTVTETAKFFSYRRDGQTGRMATLIYTHNNCT